MIDLVSDLHVENHHNIDWKTFKNEGSNYLIVAGDTSNSIKRTIKEMDLARSAYEHVCFVDGNHEHYTPRTVPYSWPLGWLKDNNTELQYKAKNNDITFLNDEYNVERNIKIIPELKTAIIGCNGWYDFNYFEDFYSNRLSTGYYLKYNNDSKFLTAEQATKIAKNDFGKLIKKLRYINESDSCSDINNIIIVTHTIPHKSGITDKPDNIVWTYLNGSFYNSMMQTIDKSLLSKVRIWCFGHTHDPKFFEDSGIQYICNPRGYVGETSQRAEYRPVQLPLDNFVF